jgi:hypothetical protein
VSDTTTDPDKLTLLHINATLQTLRAGPVEMLCVAAFGRRRIVATPKGRLELRKWRGRSYLWRWL